MAKNKQKKADADPQKALRDMLNAIVKPFQESLKAFQTNQLNISKGVQRNAKNIEAIAKKEAPASIIPKELLAVLPDVVSGIFDFFTKPDTAPEAGRMGIFDTEMMAAYKKDFMSKLTVDTSMRGAQLDRMLLDNKALAKRLEDEY